MPCRRMGPSRIAARGKRLFDSLLALGLSGLFAFPFLEELELRRAACCTAAVGLSLSVFCCS